MSLRLLPAVLLLACGAAPAPTSADAPPEAPAAAPGPEAPVTGPTPPVAPTPDAAPSASATPAPGGLARGQAPIALDAPALAAELARPAGMPRLVNFWATWCAPCMAELPRLVRFARLNRDVDVVFVNVDATLIQERRVPAVIKAQGLDIGANVLMSADDPAPALRTHIPDWPDAIPVTWFIDAAGRRTDWVMEELSDAALTERIARARAGAP